MSEIGYSSFKIKKRGADQININKFSSGEEGEENQRVKGFLKKNIFSTKSQDKLLNNTTK